jgi:hypothetical protein
MLKVDVTELRRFAQDLDKFAHKAIPHAVRNSLNRSAFEGQREWRTEIKRTFTVRRPFTEKSIQVTKARGVDLSTMAAELGSTAEYMAAREEGETKRKGGKHGVPIPTVGGARGGSIKRLIQRPNRMGAIKLTDRARTGTRKQRNAVAIRRALKAGNRFVFLETDTGKGIFRITGAKRRLRVRMVWDLSKKSVTVAPFETLARTLKAIEPKLTQIHLESLREQLRRHHIMGY